MFGQVSVLHFVILFVAALWAGAQNQLAGGGSFITLPALILTGMDARTANITSAVALFPGQVAGSWMGREHVSGTARLSFRGRGRGRGRVRCRTGAQRGRRWRSRRSSRR